MEGARHQKAVWVALGAGAAVVLADVMGSPASQYTVTTVGTRSNAAPQACIAERLVVARARQVYSMTGEGHGAACEGQGRPCGVAHLSALVRQVRTPVTVSASHALTNNSITASPPLPLAVLALRSLIQHLAAQQHPHPHQQQQQQGPHPRPPPSAPTPTRLVVLAHSFSLLAGNTLSRTLEVSREGTDRAYKVVSR